MIPGWWVSDYIAHNQTPLLAAYVFWMIASITLHELSHGWVATWQGDDTPRATGHLTINPIVHMGWMSLLFFAISGMAWGQMPVNPNRFRWGKRGDFLVSFAGPAMNVVLAFLAATTLGILSATYWRTPFPDSNFADFLRLGAWLNLGLFIFNLIPVPPLDGAHMLASASRTAHRIMQYPFLQSFGIFIAIIGLRESGLAGVMWGAGARVAIWWEQIVYRLLT